MCVCVYVHVSVVYTEARRGHRVPCELSCGCWEPNPCPLQEQHVCLLLLRHLSCSKKMLMTFICPWWHTLLIAALERQSRRISVSLGPARAIWWDLVSKQKSNTRKSLESIPSSIVSPGDKTRTIMFATGTFSWVNGSPIKKQKHPKPHLSTAFKKTILPLCCSSFMLYIKKSVFFLYVVHVRKGLTSLPELALNLQVLGFGLPQFWDYSSMPPAHSLSW